MRADRAVQLDRLCDMMQSNVCLCTSGEFLDGKDAAVRRVVKGVWVQRNSKSAQGACH